MALALPLCAGARGATVSGRESRLQGFASSIWLSRVQKRRGWGRFQKNAPTLTAAFASSDDAPRVDLEALLKAQGLENAEWTNISISPGKLTFITPVVIEETLTTDPALEDLAGQVEEDVARAVELAVKDYEAAQKAQAVQVSVCLCTDEHIQGLNKKWRGEDYPTDVLSFAQGQNQDPGDTFLTLGELVISLETAAVQAQEQGHSLLDEVRVLMIHGLLHLLGYDHERGAEELNKMAKQEQFLLKSLGWKGEGLITVAASEAEAEG